eukprot:CAMPEP_0206272430 /NCGR_PEP_ID=MMETSP0047_2-20121206/34002_1 /ASSEMBLY_ACC=CAM_ASM_000192 /TAXON_ID=195065 /ORGANISM="Chroomonas mesostigmatica_cf, Strain CCMP1168" /LENGTH=43 /DNA_ID= /DNA_START= /DNA_END= /DNA_ORIENTATION=
MTSQWSPDARSAAPSAEHAQDLVVRASGDKGNDMVGKMQVSGF